MGGTAADLRRGGLQLGSQNWQEWHLPAAAGAVLDPDLRAWLGLANLSHDFLRMLVISAGERGTCGLHSLVVVPLSATSMIAGPIAGEHYAPWSKHS